MILKKTIIFKKSKDNNLWDSNNNKYIDFSMSNGALILGHSNKLQINSLKKQINYGLNYSNDNLPKYNYSKALLKYFNNFHEVIFSNSGSEANTRAYRICKSISKKKDFAMVSGAWHGSLDSFMFDIINGKKTSLSSGNKDNLNNVHILPHNDLIKSLKILRKFKNKICMIIIECVQASFPNIKNIKYLKSIYNFAKKNGILIVFDEVITGLRVAKLAIHKKYNLKPDIVTFGKCFGAGLPIGITLISKKISYKLKKLEKKVFFGGTFSGNPLSMSAGLDTFRYLKKNKEINNRINKMSMQIESEINNYTKKRGIDFKIIRYESILRPIFTSKEIFGKIERSKFDYQNKNSNFLRNFLIINKINLPRNGCIFISSSHKRSDIIYLTSCLKKFLKIYYDD